MYTVPGNYKPLGWQTIEGSPGRTCQAWGGSFLLLLRRHTLSSRWLWTFNHNLETAWKKFKDLLPVLFSRHLSFKTCDRVYSSCVRSTVLHASETWPLAKPNLQRLQRNDRAMIRQICNVRPQDIVTTRSNELLVRLGIEDLDLILKERRLRWYGHVECSNGAVKTAFDIQVEGKCGPGGPKMTWKQLTERDCREWKLSPSTLMIDIPGDLVWYLTCVQQASYLEGSHWCGCCPCTCTLVKNLIMMMIWVIRTVGKRELTETADLGSVKDLCFVIKQKSLFSVRCVWPLE